MSEVFGPTDSRELKTSGSDTGISTHKPSTTHLGPHTVKPTSSAVITITLPLAVASSSARLLSTLAKERVFVPMSGLGWATMGAVNGVFKALTWATEAVRSGEAARALTNSAQEINGDLIDASRNSPQQTINTVDVAIEIAAQEAKAEQALSWWGKQHLKSVFDLLRCASPTILQALHSVVMKAEGATEWLKQKCYSGMMQSDLLSEHLLNWAGRTDAIRWKLIYSQEEERERPGNLSLAEYKLLSREEQEDILFLVADSSSSQLSQEKLREIQDSLVQLQSHAEDTQADRLIQELLVAYSLLPREEKYKLTPADFRAMDDIEKIKALRICRRSSNDKTKKEHYELSHFNRLRKRQDSQKLSKEEKEKLERVVISTFNRLPPTTKNQLNNFVLEQIQELSVEDQKILFNLALAKVSEKGTDAEKTEFETLKIKPSLESDKDLQAIASCLNKYLDSKEKALLLGSLKTHFAVIQLRPDELAEWINLIETRLKGASDALDLEKELKILKSYQTKAASQSLPIDMAKVLNTIGPHIVSQGSFIDASKKIGSIAERSLHSIGLLSAQLFSSMSSSPLASWTESLMNKTAFSIELLMQLPYGRELVANLLMQAGVPVYKIEQAFAKLFSLAPQAALSVEGTVLDGMKQSQIAQPIVAAINRLGAVAVAKSKRQASSWKSWFESTVHTKIGKNQFAKSSESKTIQEASQISKEALLELDRMWSALIQKSAGNARFSQFVEQLYQHTTRPMMKQTITTLETLHHIHSANLQTELRPMVTGLPILNWLFHSSQSLFILPFIVQRLLPHLLRSAGSCVGTYSRPLWISLAQGSRLLAKESASWVKSEALSIGSWLQRMYKEQLERGTNNQTIDPERIKNFFTLTPKEQRHLFEIAIASGKIHGKEREYLNTYSTKLFLPQKQLEEAVQLVLKSLDQLESHELLNLSPTSFDTLEPKIKQRIKEIIHRHTKITSATEIVNIFNKLPKEVKEEIRSLTVGEFFELSTSEQNEILFSVAHSDAYKHFTDSHAERIVRKINALPGETRLTVETYRKLSLSDQEKIRLRIALQANFFKEMPFATLDEKVEWEEQMSSSLPQGWEFEQNKSLDRLSNHRLRNILFLHSTLSLEEKNCVTPSKLLEMGEAKISHLIEIINRYHPERFSSYRLNVQRVIKSFDETPAFISARKLREEHSKALASLFNSLSSTQKAELLQMTVKEFRFLSLEEKRELILFLMQDTKQHELLEEQLMLLCRDAPVAEQKILSLFNGLGRLSQAEWRQKREVGTKQKERILQTIEEECQLLETRMRACEKRIAKLSDREYLSTSLRLEQARGEQAELQKEIYSQKIAFQSLNDAIRTLPTNDGSESQKLTNLKTEIAKKQKESASTQRRIKELEEKQAITVQKIAHLNGLKMQWYEKLTALRRVAGKEVDTLFDPEMIAESAQTVQIIDQMIFHIVNEVGNTTQKGMINTLQKKAPYPEEFRQTLAYSRELLDEMITIYQEQLSSVKEKIKTLQKTIGSLDGQEAIEKGIELRGLYHFSLKLNSALVEKFRHLKVQFEQEIQTLEYKRLNELAAQS